jgi:Zn-finger nucleic acid-binding protein
MKAKQLNVSGGELDEIIAKNRSPKGKRYRAKKERQRLAEWAKFLKDDGDFDYSCILSVLSYKLKRTREHIIEHDIVADAAKIGEQILVVEEMINKVIDDNAYYEKIVVPRYKNASPSEDRAARRQITAAFKRSHVAREGDLRMALSLMAENIWGWWD